MVGAPGAETTGAATTGAMAGCRTETASEADRTAASAAASAPPRSWNPKSCAWASVAIWIRSAAHQEPKYVFEAPGLHHLCLKAETPFTVDAVHDMLRAIESRADWPLLIDAPKLYPQYAPDYYAVFFRDPDGIKLEVAYY